MFLERQTKLRRDAAQARKERDALTARLRDAADARASADETLAAERTAHAAALDDERASLLARVHGNAVTHATALTEARRLATGGAQREGGHCRARERGGNGHRGRRAGERRVRAARSAKVWWWGTGREAASASGRSGVDGEWRTRRGRPCLVHVTPVIIVVIVPHAIALPCSTPRLAPRSLSLPPLSLSLSLSLSLPPPPLLPGSLGEVRRERDALASLAKAERTEAALRVAELEATQERLQEQANERMECVPRPRGHRGIRRFPFLP